MQNINELWEKLPPDIQQKVIDFAQLQLKKRENKEYQLPNFNWKGAISDLKNHYTSVELQHKILDLRIL